MGLWTIRRFKGGAWQGRGEGVFLRGVDTTMHAMDVIEYLGVDGPLVNSTNVNKGITTLALNLNVNSYMESIKNRT